MFPPTWTSANGVAVQLLVLNKRALTRAMARFPAVEQFLEEGSWLWKVQAQHDCFTDAVEFAKMQPLAYIYGTILKKDRVSNMMDPIHQGPCPWFESLATRAAALNYFRRHNPASRSSVAISCNW